MSISLRRSSALLRPLAAAQARRLHSSVPKSSASGSASMLNADDGKLGTKLYHAVNMVVLAGVPAAIATSPSALTMPLDIVLGLAMPLHAHIGVNYVISDYVPKASRGVARGAMLAASVMAALGLLKLNLTGAGLTETLKAIWKEPELEIEGEKKTA
ncbi:unnamed protein product [Hapterophycus canaliculatus]